MPPAARGPPWLVPLLSAALLFDLGAPQHVCSESGTDCSGTGCCQDKNLTCFTKDKYWADCKFSCTPGLDLDDPIESRTPWSCKVRHPPEGPWLGGLRATHFWDCNGMGCDSTVLHPFREERYIAAPQYAPTDPNDFGGPKYGEKMWLTGAASDALAEMIGPDSDCCGSDKMGQGCGRCLLIRSPSALQDNWTAVVMKKSRCPPASKGCEKGEVHMDIAVPGFDVLGESTANVCGKNTRDDTFIDRKQSAVCAGWYKKADNTAEGCTCGGLPNKTDEQKLLRKGCELFASWGWTSGDPRMEYYPVDCPKAFEERISEAFSPKGISPVSEGNFLWLLLSVCGVVGAICIAVGVLNWFSKKREEKAREEQRRKIQERKRTKNNPNAVSVNDFSSYESAELTSSESE